MTKVYRIEIHWVQSYDSGLWLWNVYDDETEEHLKSGSSYYRWWGMRKASKWCEQHKAGKLKEPDDGSRTVYFRP
jgi:hypothetical protein